MRRRGQHCATTKAQRRHERRVRHWSSVIRWTVLGTLGCMAVAIGFNTIAFADLGREALNRSVMSAIALSVLLGVPLFSITTLRLRGMAISNIRLDMMVRTDGLTSCLTRTAFVNRVSAQLERRDATGGGALLMIDADHFKAVNDRYGHDRGDEALTIISRTIRRVVRPGDVVGRMGGEEFAVYLPGADEKTAEGIAERIRRAVQLSYFAPAGRPRPLTVSIGGAVFETAPPFPELFRVADQRLYAAKSGGRNRVNLIHQTDLPPVVMADSKAA
jgi:diguanylate cyclase (GGDEF)-like protein